MFRVLHNAHFSGFSGATPSHSLSPASIPESPVFGKSGLIQPVRKTKITNFSRIRLKISPLFCFCPSPPAAGKTAIGRIRPAAKRHKRPPLFHTGPYTVRGSMPAAGAGCSRAISNPAGEGGVRTRPTRLWTVQSLFLEGEGNRREPPAIQGFRRLRPDTLTDKIRDSGPEAEKKTEPAVFFVSL